MSDLMCVDDVDCATSFIVYYVRSYWRRVALLLVFRLPLIRRASDVFPSSVVRQLSHSSFTVSKLERRWEVGVLLCCLLLSMYRVERRANRQSITLPLLTCWPVESCERESERSSRLRPQTTNQGGGCWLACELTSRNTYVCKINMLKSSAMNLTPKSLLKSFWEKDLLNLSSIRPVRK